MLLLRKVFAVFAIKSEAKKIKFVLSLLDKFYSIILLKDITL